MASVEVEHVSRHFGSLRAVDDVSIRFADGGFYALLGPSGSGKTTLLRMIAGFEYPDQGQIIIGGEHVEHVPVERRHIGMVFQNYALFPNMNVADNVGFGLAVRGIEKLKIKQQVSDVLDIVRLQELGSRKPHQLSGGQRQRVALARAIITRPRVLLLDEPLSALDKALRVDMQVELKRIQREIGITTIFVTHDQEEALTISDRIGILRDGKLVQEGTPEEIYHRPQSEFAATFLGDANIFYGRREGNNFHLVDGRVMVLGQSGDIGKIWDDAKNLACAVRPEHIRITAPDAPLPDGGQNSLVGHIERRIFSGNSDIYYVNCAQGESQTPWLIKVMIPNGVGGAHRLSHDAVWSQGERVRLIWYAQSTLLVKAEAN